MKTIFQVKQVENENSLLSDFPPRSEKNNSNNLLTPETEILLDYYQPLSDKRIKSSEPKIRVGETLGILAVAYERIRNALDYKGEHLLRRNAIERILRRQLWENPAIARDTQKFADLLIKELIWARYLKNNSVPKSRSKKVAQVITKYLKLLGLLSDKYNDRKQTRVLSDWFLGVISAEIEEILDPSLLKVGVLVSVISSWFNKKFEWENSELNKAEKNIQLNIVIHKSLFKSDQVRVRYHLLKYFYPSWGGVLEDEVGKRTSQLVRISQKIEHQLSSPYQPKLYRVVQKEIVQFQILTEIIERKPKEARNILSNPEKLAAETSGICENKYNEIGRRVNRGIVRSIIYIFSTKILLALIIEIPYEHYFLGGIKPVPIGINLIIPLILMLVVGLSIKKPGSDNTRVIIERISDFVYNTQNVEKTTFSIALKNQNTRMHRIFWLFYAFLFLLIIGVISFILFKTTFSIVSGLIFFMFLSLVLLFGFRVRFSASELKVTTKKEGFFSHILTNLSLPLLNLGVWMTSQLSKINFLTVALDFLIEAPLKSILGVFQEWASFIKERREEVIEVPEN